MIKKNAADEIALEMSEVIKPKFETDGSKILAALAHLNCAAELLDSAEMNKSAETITNIIIETSSRLKRGQ